MPCQIRGERGRVTVGLPLRIPKVCREASSDICGAQRLGSEVEGDSCGPETFTVFLKDPPPHTLALGIVRNQTCVFQDLRQALSVQGAVDTCLADANMGSANVSGHHTFAA